MRRTRGIRRGVAATAAAIAVIVGTVFGAGAASAAPILPSRMAALGDSITQAAATCFSLTTCPANSWSTGTSPWINSHASRLRAAGAAGLVAFNDAVDGAASAALAGQANQAVAQGAQYVTIEIGANDACASSVASMTPTATFKANVASALSALSASSARPQIFVASIPSLMRLYEVGAGNSVARFMWSVLGTCPSMLANPTSMAPADVARRAAVQAQVDAYNVALQTACAATANCRFDGFTVANYRFTSWDISKLDYFHPSFLGQAKLAAITWAASQWAS